MRVVAGFTFVWAAFRVFGCVEVTEVLELVVLLHVIVDGYALPVGGVEFPMFGALFGYLDFAMGLG